MWTYTTFTEVVPKCGFQYAVMSNWEKKEQWVTHNGKAEQIPTFSQLISGWFGNCICLMVHNDA